MPAKNEPKKVHPNVTARVLPHSDDAEQAVLGCVLIDEDAPVAIISELKPEDFYEPAHKQIFTAMSALYNRDKPIDYVTLVEELTEAGVIDSVGGMSYIISLTNYVPSAANYRHYLEIVKKTSTLRKLISSSQQIMDIAYSGDAEDKALSFAEGEIYGIAEKQDRGTLIDMNEAVDRAFRIMDEKQADPTAQRTVPIPFTKLNELLGGFHPSDLVLIAARPACGKTSLGMNFISHAALDKSRKTPAGKVDPFKCAVFSLEMSAEQIATRLLCSVAKVSMEHVNSGMRTVQENMRLVEAQRKLSEAKVFIDDSSLTTPIEILSKCRRLKRRAGTRPYSRRLPPTYEQRKAGRESSAGSQRYYAYDENRGKRTQRSHTFAVADVARHRKAYRQNPADVRPSRVGSNRAGRRYHYFPPPRTFPHRHDGRRGHAHEM